MPAESDRGVELPRTWRPLGARIAAAIFGLVLIGAFTYLWLSFDQQTKESVNVLQRLTVVGFVAVGLMLLFGLSRSRVTATATGIDLVNGFRRHHYEWAEIIAIRMPPGAPWPTADLADGTVRSLLGIQGSDGDRAKQAVRELRRLMAAQTRLPDDG